MKHSIITIITENKHIDYFVLIPETDEENRNGLSKLAVLEPEHGMLYMYKKRYTPHQMYTKDTPFPVDFIFIDSFGNIQEISTAQPFSECMHESTNSVAVLEINGGECEKLGISIGDTVLYAKSQITPNNEFIFLGMNFQKITHKTINKINFDNLYFVAHAEYGAMGWAGAMQFLTIENNKVKKYMIDKTGMIDENRMLSPLILNFSPSLFEKKINIKHWQWVNLGMGNHLFIKKEIYNEFMKQMTNIIKKPSLSYMYRHWPYIAQRLLQDKINSTK